MLKLFCFALILLQCPVKIDGKTTLNVVASTSTLSLPVSDQIVIQFKKVIQRKYRFRRPRNIYDDITPDCNPAPVNSSHQIKHSSIYVTRLLLFLFYGTLGSALPYIPLYYRYLGIPEDKIGILGAITPAVTFIVSPIWGAFADVTGKHKLIMLLTFIGSVITRCGLMIPCKNIFWISSLVAFSAILNAPVKPLMDSAVMSMIIDKTTYGKSQLFGQLGFGFGSYLVGPFLAKNMHYIFPMHALLAIPTALVMMTFTPKPSEVKVNHDILSAVKHVAMDSRILVFFGMIFLIGLSSGIGENFAYVRIAEVGGVGLVLSFCRLASSIAGVPTFWLAGQITRAIGVNGVLSISLTSYIIRLIIYAAIRNPWQALPAEILRGLIFGVFWSSSTSHVYQIAPKGLTATMLGLLNAVYGGLGQSVGSLIGGTLSKRVGIPKAFYIWSVVDVAVLLLFLMYQALHR